jgi:hypothetical protein
MKLLKISLSCASLIVPSLLMFHTAPAQAATTLEQEATGTIRELQGQASALANRADQFRIGISDNESSWDSQLWQLDTLKSDINAMGRELQTLQTERDSPTPWQRQAIDRAQVLLKDVVTNTNEAIDYFNGNRGHLWTPEYRGYVSNVRKDSEQLSHDLKIDVNLAKVRDREQRLSASGQ